MAAGALDEHIGRSTVAEPSRSNHMDVEVTVDDPKMYARTFTIKFTARLLPDTDILESVCAENEKDRVHLDR